MFVGRAIQEWSTSEDLSTWLSRLNIIDSNAFADKSRADYRRTQLRYQQLASSLQPLTPCWPVQSVILRIFLVYSYYTNKQSAKSLANYLTHIKSGQLCRGFAWLNQSEAYSVQVTMRALQRCQPNKTIRRRTPITLRLLDLLEQGSAPLSLNDLEFFTFCRVSHNGLLRGGEARSLRFSSMIWNDNRTGFELIIVDSKANKTGPPERVPFLDWGTNSAVFYMRRYLSSGHLWRFLDSDNLLFPHLQSAPKITHYLRSLSLRANLITDLAGHSFRSGGACDLWAANVPIEAIMKAGRWRSDAIRLYLRDTDVTSVKVAEAFRFCHRHGFDLWSKRAGS